MHKKFIPIFSGINLDLQRRIINDDKLAAGKNIIFQEGRVLTRPGYTTLGTNLPLCHGGTVSFGDTANGKMVTAFAWYDHLRTGTTQLLCFTTRDSYLYDFTTKIWTFITKRYITGMASCPGGDPTVTGALTVWKPGGVGIGATGGICAIKFGTIDPNGVGTPDTWYYIDSWTNDTSLELTANGPNTVGLVNYVIRLCWSGDEEDIHSIAIPTDATTNEKLLCVTNGVDNIQKWDGGVLSDYLQDLGGAPNKARYLHYFYDTLTLGWVIDTGVDYPQTIEVADRTLPESWPHTGMWNLADGDDEIVGMERLQTRLIIYKEHSITEAYSTNDASNPLEFNERKIANFGTPSIRTICNFGDYHLFMGWETIYYYNGISITDIGEDIADYMFRNISPEKIKQSFAVMIDELGLYCLFITESGYSYPNMVYIYNVKYKSWTIWEMDGLTDPASRDFFTAWGHYYEDLSKTWNDLHIANGSYVTGTVTVSNDGLGRPRIVTLVGGTWDTTWTSCAIKFNTAVYTAAGAWYEVASIDTALTLTLAEDGPVAAGVAHVLGTGPRWMDMIGRWRDLMGTANEKVYCFGDNKGNTYKMDFIEGYDNGQYIYSGFETKDFELTSDNATLESFRLLSAMLGMTLGIGTIRIRASANFGRFWTAWRTIDLAGLVDFVEHYCNFNIRGRQLRITVENIDGTQFEMESLKLGYIDAGKNIRR